MNRETDNIGFSRRRQAKQKHNTICVGHHYMQANTNNVNHTWAPLRPTGGKDEPSIVFYAEIVTTSQHGTQNVKIHNKTTLKIKNLINTDPAKNMINTDPAKKHDQHGPHQKTWSTRTPPKNITRTPPKHMINTDPAKKYDQHGPRQKTRVNINYHFLSRNYKSKR
jgi:hypothetical protein